MGFSLGEIVLIILVGIIVVGPKNLPGLMRTAGQWIARIRRMSTDLRSQSGIDDMLRQEGLEEHIHELRSLSRLNVVDTLMAPALAPRPALPAPRSPSPTGETPDPPGSQPSRPAPVGWAPQEPLREREYPLVGCDAYGALPDDLVGHDGGAETLGNDGGPETPPNPPDHPEAAPRAETPPTDPYAADDGGADTSPNPPTPGGAEPRASEVPS